MRKLARWLGSLSLVPGPCFSGRLERGDRGFGSGSGATGFPSTWQLRSFAETGPRWPHRPTSPFLASSCVNTRLKSRRRVWRGRYSFAARAGTKQERVAVEHAGALGSRALPSRVFRRVVSPQEISLDGSLCLPPLAFATSTASRGTSPGDLSSARSSSTGESRRPLPALFT